MTAEQRRFLNWLAERATDTDDTGDLARGHRDGLIDLSWHALTALCAAVPPSGALRWVADRPEGQRAP